MLNVIFREHLGNSGIRKKREMTDLPIVLSLVINNWKLPIFLKRKRCSLRLYLQLFVGGCMSYLCYLCLFAYSGVQHILCFVFVLFFFILCTLYCQFLWIILFDCPFGVLLLFRIRVRYRILKLRVYE